MTFALSRLALTRRLMGAPLSAAILALTACGGGGGDAMSSTPEAADAKTMRALDADTSWATIAHEGERFSVAGTQTVRYGSSGTWTTMQVNGSGECSNGAFGRDPLFGVVKECQTQPGSDGGWTAIALEQSSFTVSGTGAARAGLPRPFPAAANAAMNFSAPTRCSASSRGAKCLRPMPRRR